MDVYTDLARQCEKIDRRSTKYQFDLDNDLSWEQLSAPGLHFTNQILDECGVDTAVLDADPAARELFEWSFAIASCRVFEQLELSLLRVIEHQHDQLKDSRSIALLVEEEKKHILMFQRYANHLERQKPAEAVRLGQLFARCQHLVSIGREVELPEEAAFLKEQFLPVPFPQNALSTYMFWMSMLFFEEYTIYLHLRLAEDVSVQPTWRAVHKAHWQEEVQHLPTNRQLVRSLALAPESQKPYVRFHVHSILRAIRYATGIDTAFELVRERFPELPPLDRNAGRPLSQHSFCEVLRTHPAFAATRGQPGFDDALARVGD